MGRTSNWEPISVRQGCPGTPPAERSIKEVTAEGRESRKAKLFCAGSGSAGLCQDHDHMVV